MALQALLGDKVVKGAALEETDVSSLAGEGKVIGIYFSAHWCPPCRAFTPQLATWYTKFKAGPNGDKFYMVFVSSDRDDKMFKEYFAEMPWYALPYELREKKNELSRKFKVSGIPTLVMVNAETGSLITSEGRSIVMEDTEGKEFPWKPKPFHEVVKGKFVGKDLKELDSDTIKDKVVGLYFSAHWCGPCRSFTPQLVRSYNKIKEDNKNFEIIFVTSDRDEQSFKEYFAEMPWIAVPFEDSRKKNLSRLFDVAGIPTLVIVDESGKTITTHGRAAIISDPDGKEFPWHPKPVNFLNGNTAGDINDMPCLIWFTSDDKAAKTQASDTVQPIAEEWIAKWKGEDNKMAFFVASNEDDDDDIIPSLRTFAGLGTETPLVAIVDIPNQQVYPCDSEDINADVVKKFVQGFFDKTITGKPLKP